MIKEAQGNSLAQRGPSGWTDDAVCAQSCMALKAFHRGFSSEAESSIDRDFEALAAQGLLQDPDGGPSFWPRFQRQRLPFALRTCARIKAALVAGPTTPSLLIPRCR
jgi:hypothetical protein